MERWSKILFGFGEIFPNFSPSFYGTGLEILQFYLIWFLLWNFMLNGLNQCIEWMRDNNKKVIESTQAVEDEWMVCQEVADPTVYKSCNSWYNGSNIDEKAKEFLPFIGSLLIQKRLLRSLNRITRVSFSIKLTD
ncbi:MAG: hypothetical protein CM1200mP12_17800 [Gammaproteobacteria bacterium]|nr:MAG: hypothetical protein CM1200mP12_17800 [Gammaproteobacteria bacterium]